MVFETFTFKNRMEAARRLAESLQKYLTQTQTAPINGKKPLVLAIPRGAVPMGHLLADALDGEFDVVLVHKFGLPHRPEYALGSVTEEGDVYLGLGAERLDLEPSEIEDAALAEVHKLQTRRRAYTPLCGKIDPAKRTVIIVDDGIATGATMIAAVRALKSQPAARQAARIIVATPVTSPEAVRRLEMEGAEVISLLVPEVFFAVSQFYDEFEQVSDEEVLEILSKTASRTKAEEGHKENR